MVFEFSRRKKRVKHKIRIQHFEHVKVSAQCVLSPPAGLLDGGSTLTDG